MIEPFIKNHHYNLIRKQTGIVQSALKTVADPMVMEAVRYSAQTKVLEAFPKASDIQKQLLEMMVELETPEEFHQYLQSLHPFLTEFPQVTEAGIRKLFPKVKKLKVPDLTTFDYRFLTYLGWNDIASTKLYIVYPLHGKAVGVEGRYTLLNKKDVCTLCRRHGEVALVTAFSKSRPANASPDYYKALGNYMCVDSQECNKNITDVFALERFIENVMG